MVWYNGMGSYSGVGVDSTGLNSAGRYHGTSHTGLGFLNLKQMSSLSSSNLRCVDNGNRHNSRTNGQGIACYVVSSGISNIAGLYNPSFRRNIAVASNLVTSSILATNVQY